MRHRFFNGRDSLVAAVIFCAALTASPAFARPTIQMSFNELVRSEPFTGRVVLFLWPAEKGRPPRNWEMISEDPIASVDVEDWKPGTKLAFKPTRSYPGAFDEIDGKYRIRAVMQNNTSMPNGLATESNIASKWTAVNFTAKSKRKVSLKLSRINGKPERQKRELLKFVSVKSELLSAFHHRDVELKASVRLPEGYSEEDAKRYPAIYIIPGFGGDDRQALQMAQMLGDPDEPFIRVGLDPTLRFGHTVYADSDNNGPCGRALVEELIPYLEKNFKLIAEPRGRYLTGHSSGGWSSLWLQITYPEFFNGCWSGSPDPVDFHDFTGVNLYKEDNMYKFADGQARPIMRQNGRVLYSIEQFAKQEDVIGPGGQLMAFEAVFSPKGKDGQPIPLYDRKTGAINHKVVESWKRYDIVNKLTREWPTIGPKLKGKITVIMGDADNFYLNGAAHILKEKLAELGSDARVTIVPDLDHMTIVFAPPYRAVITEITEKFRASKPD